MSHGPLEGRRVVVTRGTDKADQLPRLLEEAGAIVVKVPLITSIALASDAEVRAAIGRLDGGDSARRRWLVLTSETAVALVSAAVGAAALAGIDVAVVGPATAAALRSHGLHASLVAGGQEAESLAADLGDVGVDGAAVLVIAAAGGRQVVAPAVEAGGARVEVLEAYRSGMPDGATERLRMVFAEARVDAITFTSGSTVRHCAIALPDPPPHCTAVCIGPVTARAAREAGWGSIITAIEHTSAGVVAALTERLRGAHPLP